MSSLTLTEICAVWKAKWLRCTFKVKSLRNIRTIVLFISSPFVSHKQTKKSRREVMATPYVHRVGSVKIFRT